MEDEDDADGSVRWFSYAEGAKELGIRVQSFRRLSSRQAWRRMTGNDGGVRVAVPVQVLDRYRTRRNSTPPAALRGDARAITMAETVAALLAKRRAAEEKVRDLQAQLALRDERLARVEGEVVHMRNALRSAEAVLLDAAAARHEAEAQAGAAVEAASRTKAEAAALHRELEEARMVLAEEKRAHQARIQEQLGIAEAAAGRAAAAEAAMRAAEEAAQAAEAAQQAAEARAEAEAARAAGESEKAAEAVRKADEAERRAMAAETRQQAVRAEAERRAEEARRQAAEAASKQAVPRPWWQRLLGR